MDRKINKAFFAKGNESMITSLYYLYKEYIIGVAFIISGIAVIILILTPQITLWFELQKQARELRQTNAILTDNLDLLSSFSPIQIDERVKVVGGALPPNKEFAAVLNSVSQASAKSNVSLGDYTFQVGEIASKSAAPETLKRPAITITLSLSGSVEFIKNFLNELYKQVPLVEASEISYTTTSSLATVDFFYKPYSPVQVNLEKPILKISGSDQVVLDTISQWGNSN